MRNVQTMNDGRRTTAKTVLVIVACLVALSVGAMFPINTSSAQFIDRIVRPCGAGVTPRAQVVANPNNTGNVAITTCTGGSVTINGVAVLPGGPGGANTQVQFNDSGAFGGDAGLTYIKATDALSVAGTINGLTIVNNLPSGTFSLVAGATLTVNNTMTLASTNGAAVQFVNGGTVAYLADNLGAFAATTSAQLRTVLSDENGTGAALFDSATSPTFLTGLTVPLVSGGTAAGSTLQLQGSSNATPAASFVRINPQTVAGTTPAGVFIGGPTSRTVDSGSISDVIHAQGSDGKEPWTVMDGFGGQPKLVGRRAQGTTTTPTATGGLSSMFTVGGAGYQTTTGAYTGFASQITFGTMEAFTSTANGANIQFLTTLIGTTSLVERLRITDAGNLNLGSATFISVGAPGIAGNGTLNANSDDSAGKVTSTGTGASTVVLTFATTFTRAPACFVNNETTANLARAVSTTTTVTINATVVTGDVISYVCVGY